MLASQLNLANSTTTVMNTKSLVCMRKLFLPVAIRTVYRRSSPCLPTTVAIAIRNHLTVADRIITNYIHHQKFHNSSTLRMSSRSTSTMKEALVHPGMMRTESEGIYRSKESTDLD